MIGPIGSPAACACRRAAICCSSAAVRGRSPGQLSPLNQAPPASERLQQDRGDLRHQAPPVPVTRQPPHVRDRHRVKVTNPPVLPARALARLRRHRERLRVPGRNPVIRPDVNDHGTPVVPANEEVRSMPTGAAALITPAEPERLRRNLPHCRVEVHEHQVILLQPGFEPDMHPCRGEVPPARETPNPLLEPERPGRQRILEPRAMTRRQSLTPPGTISNLELHRESLTCGTHRDSNPSHQPALSSQESGNGPTIVTKPWNGPSSLTMSELNCHRTTAGRVRDLNWVVSFARTDRSCS